MARTQEALFALIKNIAPGWLWAEIGDAEAVMWGWAKILERFEADLDAHLAATTIGEAAGLDLGLHMIDHGLARTTGETAAHQRTRIAAQLKVRAVTRPGIYALISDIVEGEVIIRTVKRDAVFYNRQRFLNRRYYVWDDKSTMGFVVYVEPQADPDTYAAAWRALEAAAAALIPARLEVLIG